MWDVANELVEKLGRGWQCETAPFPNSHVGTALPAELASSLAAELPDLDDWRWRRYENPLERKQLINYWDAFGPNTYRLLTILVSESFSSALGSALKLRGRLLPDPGLNGGGWHVHLPGSWLNTHRDYDSHPKLDAKRHLNLIFFLQPSWQTGWGGHLEFWSGSEAGPKAIASEVEPSFNSAVLFQTSGVAWHGVGQIAPEAHLPRVSLAVYYVLADERTKKGRAKALFYPSDEQRNDPEIAELIAKRADAEMASKVYE